MNDLVKNLRDLASFAHADLSVADEAADRIEQLEAALREIAYKTRDAHPMSYLADYFRIARAALEGKDD